MMKRRVTQFLSSADCRVCKGKRLKPEAPRSPSPEWISRKSRWMPLKQLRGLLGQHLDGPEEGIRQPSREGSRAEDHWRHVCASGGPARPRSWLSDARAARRRCRQEKLRPVIGTKLAPSTPSWWEPNGSHQTCLYFKGALGVGRCSEGDALHQDFARGIFETCSQPSC